MSITIQSATQQISVPLSGNGLAPGQLGVSPSSMNFGTVTVGTSQAQTGTLTAGASDVNVSSASWNGLGFTLSGITFPVTVNAGSSRSFTVTFNPQAAGTSSGQVSFVSDATNSPTQVTLSGTGAQPVQHSVDLSWNPSTSQIIGYYIYRSNSSGSYGAPLNSTPQAGLSFTDSSVQSGSTYYYVVTAVDTNSQQSIHSNEAVAVIP
ncbi:MAG TPA: choice-of-anchor D domain-containing protein [Terriglobales bacterium]|nr:choice-of-anchor D domain-containing protein [Terriglobales bacterium]